MQIPLRTWRSYELKINSESPIKLYCICKTILHQTCHFICNYITRYQEGTCGRLHRCPRGGLNIYDAALLSDIYACCGMKIVLSGADSLAFALARKDQLYDRCVVLHTTFIPYRDFEAVLGMEGIDAYIRYGGTMGTGGAGGRGKSSPAACGGKFAFATGRSAGEYMDSAVAGNIQRSLRNVPDGGRLFGLYGLYELYEKGELKSAVYRVAEDISRQFTREVLIRMSASRGPGLSGRSLPNDCGEPEDLGEDIGEDTVIGAVQTMLEILDKADKEDKEGKEAQSVQAEESCAHRIREYLILLDLVVEVDLLHLPDVEKREKITVISQPGLRYAQADALVSSLLQDAKFKALSSERRSRILERILSEIKGRMMEEIVLLETKLASPGKQVFKLQFPAGKFDMVVFDPAELTCEIFEIKHSRATAAGQYRHLVDAEKCAATEHRFGRIIGRYVIYRGENTEMDGVQYLNVEQYLRSLGS